MLLELFTSQGCSSCPPADELLSELGRSEFKGQIIPLAYHVDYWNYLGWPDPFSQPAWTNRQHRYAAAFRKNSTYTPQLVIDGRDELVGNNSPAVLAKIRAAGGQKPAATVGLKILEYSPAQRRLKLALSAELLQASKAKELNVMVAVFENGLSTKVPHGENSGKTLLNDYVVRSLETALTLPAQAGQRVAKELVITLPSEKSGVAAFLQDPQTLEVYAAAAATP